MNYTIILKNFFILIILIEYIINKRNVAIIIGEVIHRYNEKVISHKHLT